MQIDSYRKVNESYRKSMVFHFGPFAGFFSEYNNMLRGMAFCLVNRIQFKLYSKDAKVCPRKGWSDFFEPFIEEETCDIHHFRNYRFMDKRPYTSFFFKYLKRKVKKILGYKVEVLHYDVFQRFFKDRNIKRKYSFTFYMQEIWDEFEYIPYDKEVDVPSLFHGTYFELLKEINSMIWRYSTDVFTAVKSEMDSLNLPSHYVGLHIRGGDKFKEAKIITPENYVFAALKKEKNIHDFFVFTDDFTNVKKLSELFPNDRFYTLCQKSEHGYYYDSLMAEPVDAQVQKTIRMFASVELLSNASVFIGTRTSNPYQFVEIQRDRKNCISLD